MSSFIVIYVKFILLPFQGDTLYIVQSQGVTLGYVLIAPSGRFLFRNNCLDYSLFACKVNAIWA